MTKASDPFDVLGRANPVDPEALRDAHETPEAVATLERILSTKPGSQQPKRTRRHRRAALLASALIAAVFAVTAWALSRGPSSNLTIGCYAAVSLQSDTVVIASADVPPERACRAVWRLGELGPRMPARFEVCVLHSGALGVFPAERSSACVRLGLKPAPSTTPVPSATTPPPEKEPDPKPVDDAAARALRDQLTKRFVGRCLTRTNALTTVAREIAKLRAAEWSVSADNKFTSARPCASLAFDEKNHAVLLVPIPRP